MMRKITTHNGCWQKRRMEIVMKNKKKANKLFLGDLEL